MQKKNADGSVTIGLIPVIEEHTTTAEIPAAYIDSLPDNGMATEEIPTEPLHKAPVAEPVVKKPTAKKKPATKKKPVKR